MISFPLAVIIFLIIKHNVQLGGFLGEFISLLP
jgi:hypothetical protein